MGYFEEDWRDIEESRYQQVLQECAPESEGEADGAFGEAPKEPENPRYWEGYCKGLRLHWLGKLGRQIEWEEF